MSIIKLMAPVAGLRGTLGGVVYSANKSGPYARIWSKGANPRSPFQTAQRASMSAMSALWRALSPAEKTLWNDFAALPAQDRTNSLGETFSASGFNWFTIVNTRLINIGRATRTAVPTQSRPAAPTLSSLVLPFLPQQATKVTYPAATFDPDFDQVIEISVVTSTGHTVEAGRFLLLKLDQEPPDQDSAFVLPYIARINLAGTGMKGFAKLYRQTTDGLRSSPGTASFISTDEAPYAATASDYDAVNKFATHVPDFTGNADGKLYTHSFWFRSDLIGPARQRLFSATPENWLVDLSTGGRFRVILRNVMTTVVVNFASNTTFVAGPAWHNIMFSCDTATQTILCFIDGVQDTGQTATITADAIIDFTQALHIFAGGAGGITLFDGCLSEWWVDNTVALDFSDDQVRACFVDADGFPVDLGETGAFPTGSQPIIYIRDGDPSVNRGFGGNFTNNAALSACSSDPP